MSWFNLIQQGKSIWDSHSFICNLITGDIIGNLVVDRLKNRSIYYKQFRNFSSSNLANVFAPKLPSISKKMAIKILEYSLEGEGTTSQTHMDLFKKMQFKKFIKKSIITNIQPSTENALRSGLFSILKAGIASGVDIGTKKTISAISLPIIYSLTLVGCKWTSQAFSGNWLADDLGFVTNKLPSYTTVTFASLAYHITQMVLLVWKEVLKKPMRNDLDKKQVRDLFLKYTKEPLSRKLKENRILQLVRISGDQKRIDSIVEKIISYTLDYYWKSLHDTKYLKLSLVS